MSIVKLDIADLDRSMIDAVKNTNRAPKLIIGVEHDHLNNNISFSLSVPLPRNHAALTFRYAGRTVEHHQVVTRPKVALCQTPQVKSFLNGLLTELKLDVRTLGLMDIDVHYDGSHIGYEKTIQIFSQACRRIFELGPKDYIAVLPLKEGK